MVWKWIKKFREGCIEARDESHRVDSSVIIEDIIDAVQDSIWKDHLVKLSELCEGSPQVSHGTLFEIVGNYLSHFKFVHQMVLKVLTTEHLAKLFTPSFDFTRYTNEDEDFLDDFNVR